MKAARNFLGQYDLNDNFTSPRRKICWKPTSLSGRVEKRAVTWGQKPLLDLTFFIYLVNKMLFLSGKIQGKFRECLWQPCIGFTGIPILGIWPLRLAHKILIWWYFCLFQSRHCFIVQRWAWRWTKSSDIGQSCSSSLWNAERHVLCLRTLCDIHDINKINFFRLFINCIKVANTLCIYPVV